MSRLTSLDITFLCVFLALYSALFVCVLNLVPLHTILIVVLYLAVLVTLNYSFFAGFSWISMYVYFVCLKMFLFYTSGVAQCILTCHSLPSNILPLHVQCKNLVAICVHFILSLFVLIFTYILFLHYVINSTIQFYFCHI